MTDRAEIAFLGAEEGEWWQDDKCVPMVCVSVSEDRYGFAYRLGGTIAVVVSHEDLVAQVGWRRTGGC